MPLSLEEVQHIADLARIELSIDDLEKYRTQLSEILGYFEQLQDIEPSSYPTLGREAASLTELRADFPGNSLSREALMRNASAIKDDQFSVPPVFEKPE